MRYILLSLVTAVVTVSIVAALMFMLQHALIYHPRQYPAGFERLLPRGTIQLASTTAAGQQVAFYVPPRSQATLPERIWVAFSGNASVALDWLYFAEQQPNDSDAFLLVDYPGYGLSQGRPDIASTRASTEAAVAALAAHLPLAAVDLEPRLCVLGLSLGCAAGLDFAAGHPVQRIALLAPFTSMREVAAVHFGRPASWLLREDYDNRARLAELLARRPPPRIAIFHGTADTLIPIRMGRTLAESAPGMIEFFPIEHATHDTIYGDAIAPLGEWMKR